MTPHSSPSAPAPLRVVACLAVGVAVALTPAPSSVEPGGWTLLAIFAAVIAGFLLQPYPMGPVVLLGILAAALTGALSFGELLAGYGEEVVWLVVGAFILSGAIRSTGLGERLALWLVARLGRSTLGLGYAQVLAELVLGPMVPSNTARGGGILAPIAASLARALDSHPHDAPDRAGRYLALVGAHANLITAAMFLTGMAANPLVAAAAADVYEIDFGWEQWAKGALVPGLAGLALLPLLLYVIARPTVTDGRPAQARAREELERRGPLDRAERIMAGVFVGMLLLWSSRKLLSGVDLPAAQWIAGLDTALVAWMGVGVLLATRTLTWESVTGEPRTWDALIWLGGVLSLANGLKRAGVVDWFADRAGSLFGETGWLLTALGLTLVYFYSMYGFSMLTAHISAMGAAFLVVCKGAEVPALVAVPLIAYASNLCACMTNYSSGPIIIYYGLGYVPTRQWFRVGFLVSLFHIAIWIPLGLAWWKLIGWW